MYKQSLATMLLFAMVYTTLAQVKAGDKAPDLHITNWIQNIPANKSLKGKFLVVDFWATWCGPCLGSVPHFNTLTEANKNNHNLQFISVSDEKESKIRRLLPKVPFSSLVVSDSTGQVFKDYGIQTIPYCVLVDDQMQVKWAGTAEELTAAMIRQFVQRQPIETVAAKPGNSAITRQLYDSLRKVYNPVYKDAAVKEYFNMGPLANEPYGMQGRMRGSAYYNEITIGKNLRAAVAQLLEVSETQVLLPATISKTCVSYCYKSIEKPTSAELLSRMMQQLDLQQTIRDSVQEVMTLEVTDTSLLYADLPEPNTRTSKISTSDGDKIISLMNHPVAELADVLQNRFSCVVMIKDATCFHRSAY